MPPFLSPASHKLQPFVPEGGLLGGRARRPLASPPPTSKEITQALIRSPRDRRKLECPRCLIAPAAAAGTLEARVMALTQLPSQPLHDLGRLGARCCFNEKSGLGEWLWLGGGQEGGGLRATALSPSVHAGPWWGLATPEDTKRASPRGTLGLICELGRGWGGRGGGAC